MYFINKGNSPYIGRMKAMLLIAFFPLVVLAAQPLGSISFWMPVLLIGIGASAQCDGQVLVAEDMLGLFDRVPKFVKKFGEMGVGVEDAVRAYAAGVRDRSFPGPDQLYQPV